jgi:hypothetical protein
MGKRPQEGNAGWRASRAATRCLPGNSNKRRCSATKSNGLPCNAIAIRNWHKCFMHGGAATLTRRGLYKKKLRKAWTDSKERIEQFERERKQRFAEFFDFVQGK